MKKNSERNSEYYYMQEALTLAQTAFANDEVPIGAVVVDAKGMIIGAAYNQVEQKNTQAAHAEVLAIMQAGNICNDWRLDGCAIYVTIEPCAMCFGLIRLSRISSLIFAAPSPRFGYQLDKKPAGEVYKKNMTVISGIYKQESQALIKKFFQKQRNKKVSSKVKDLTKIKQALKERKNELEAQLQKLSTERISDDQVQDPGDQALSLTMENLRHSLQDTELEEYKRILKALEKIEDGTYGICTDCGLEISEKRLKLYPNASRCLSCQELFEDRTR